jgi:hypothetical protein
MVLDAKMNLRCVTELTTTKYQGQRHLLNKRLEQVFQV